MRLECNHIGTGRKDVKVSRGMEISSFPNQRLCGEAIRQCDVQKEMWGQSLKS